MDRLHLKYNTATTLFFYIYDTAAYAGGEPKIGLGSSPYCYYSIDGGSRTNTGTTVSEVDGIYLPGVYKVVCTDVVTDGDIIILNLYYAVSSRSAPLTIYTDKTAGNLWQTEVPTTLRAEHTAINTIVAANAAAINIVDNLIDTEVAAIKSVVDSNATKLDTIDNFIDTEVAAILVDTGTTLNDKIDVIDGIVDNILVDTAVLGATPIAANVTQLTGSATAATNLASGANAIEAGTIHNSTAPTASSFLSDTGALSTQDDAYNNRLLLITSGTLKGAVGEVADYTGSTKTFTLTSALPAAPANNVTFIIV